MYLFPQAAGLETAPRGNFSHPKRDKMDLKSAFLQQTPDMTMLLHPSGAPTHLPLFYPFCSCRNYLQKDIADDQ